MAFSVDRMDFSSIFLQLLSGGLMHSPLVSLVILCELYVLNRAAHSQRVSRKKNTCNLPDLPVEVVVYTDCNLS